MRIEEIGTSCGPDASTGLLRRAAPGATICLRFLGLLVLHDAAELQELVRHGGGHVNIVFNYSELLFVLQDIRIYKAACATEGEGSEITTVSSTSEENKEGGGNFDPF
uniref:Uncharacterized protein n=1 Tax=Chromera velia CCMP2878 TaxID=1169474 RepID=A0A0G4HP83_9ALVE|eukprot:Cvel_7800.t1-p1 / transcript=Cvel_7800.t1 / gene=Cvel_7800 / organism=Chromera_velia_CCMP2878 / gene_product=hypothetical protein / transcript_product=hypothetical protein / location=Cvel_scaffold416:17799-19092(-) / protein_length=107 / sequence_SO=supercontig / SO=protein_coding / is_pseudo=false